MSVGCESQLLGGRYRLDQRVAVGGFGEVWRATDTVLTRPVAVKLLRPELSEDSGALARFRDEARHAGSLVHENVARIYDYYEPGPEQPPFLVMEFVDGSSLAQILADGPLEPWRAMQVVAQCAAGLHAAHRAGLVHRDVKPGNVLLTPEGTVRLTDFGISAAVGCTPVTATGQLLCTPAYLAPERAAGGHGSAASDIYSLGVVGYHCLAGRPPFAGPPMTVALAHLSQPLPALPATVPAEVAALIGALTAKEPEDRPAAAEVAQRAGELGDRLMPGSGRRAAGEPGPVQAAGGETGPTLAADRDPESALTAGDAEPLVVAGGDPEPALTGGGEPGPVLAAAAGHRAGTGPQPARGTPTHPLPVPGRRRLRRALAAVMVLVAAVAAVLLVGAIGHAPRHATAAAGAKTTMVKVDAKALRGRPVATVRRLLRHLGLTVDVRWRPSSLLPPGRVLAVRPAGMVRPGSHVILVGTLAPAAATVSPSASAAGTPGRPHHKPHPQPTAQPSPASSPSPAPSPSPSISTSPSPTATGSTAPARTPAPESAARPAPVR